MKKVFVISLFVALFSVAGCNKNEDVEDEPGKINGHAYVDLHLPSGTLWASCNVGANSPEEYGDYLAWGETESKSMYWWDTYKYSKEVVWNEPRLTKYCFNTSYGYSGFRDYLARLQSEDDAATVNWGQKWKTPTMDQWQELIDFTTHKRKVRNGVVGYEFVSDGDTLFLPMAGWLFYDSCVEVDTIGCYWEYSLGNQDPCYAQTVTFGHFNYGIQERFRCFGLPVRPVSCPSPR